MVKAMPFTPKPALSKLPLAARKDLRDNFEAKLEGFQDQIKNLLGLPSFTININAAEVWAYAPEENTAAGGYFAGYVEGFISALEALVSKYGENGKTYFNEAVNPLGDSGPTITSDVFEGVYRILFRHTQLGFNQTWQHDLILPAVESVPREDFSLSAKHSIENEYEGEVEPLQQEINKLCGADFILDPNFEENYKVLRDAGDKVPVQGWQSQIGGTALRYFKGLKWQLERQGFKDDDDLLQEGIQEAIEGRTFRIRVVPTMEKTNQTVIEENIVMLQCPPNRWGFNTTEMGQELLSLL
ncbi:hypothetical protein K438DRAFT_1953521 [Mycena galopus ATCC 62051]|nr:hypothetical protein K438DRAFT_1953521 [Mycena galopus ATCC 62051]